MRLPIRLSRTPIPLPAGESPTAWPVLVAAVALFVIPTVAISQVAAHWRIDVVDDQMFGYFGWRIAHGATVYRDVWDNKPPGIYWINALGFLLGGDSYAGVVALCVVALVAAHVAFFVIAASIYYRGAAAVATALAAFYLTHAYYQCGANRTETFLIPFELAAVAIYVRGFARDRWWKWYVAGACCGCAFLCKQVGLAAWGALGLHTIVCALARDIPLRAGVQRCLLLLGGAVTVVGLAAAALAAQSALHEALWATFGFNRAYFESGDSSLTSTLVNRHMLSWEIWPVLQLPILMATATVIHAGLWRLRPHLRPREVAEPLRAFGPACPRYVLLFGVWLGAAYWGAMISPHHFRHYLGPLIPPMMLLAGYLINVIQCETKLVKRLQQRAWVVAAFVAMGYFAAEAFQRNLEIYSKVYVARFELREPAEWELIGDEVARLTGPQDTIQCEGYLPGVYLRARRENACRYTTTEKIGQLHKNREDGADPIGAARDIAAELQRTLTARPPAAYVISAGSYDWIARSVQDDRTSGSYGRWLYQWLTANYTRVADVERFNVYIFKRNDLVRD